MGKHGYYLEDLNVGMEAHFEKSFSEAEVIQFSKLSGDTNPVHLDHDFAKQTMFKERIVHGALTSSLISTVLGTKLPGPGAIFLSQEIKYRAPVKLGETVLARVKIVEIDESRRKVMLECDCSVAGKVVVKGNVLVMVDRKSS